MKILLFGATGSAGAAVLDACLAASIVDEVRVIVRRPLMHTSPKLRTFVHKDFLNYATVEEAFRSVDACLFCLGISATQVSQEEYRTITYSYTLAAANMFKLQSPGAAFHYISGQGTKPGSRMFWSRVKAQTEQDLIDLVDADCWRPAFIDSKPSASLPKIYGLIQPVGRLLLKPFPNLYVHGHDIGRAMLQATVEQLRRRIIENAEIRQIAARATF
ncbi:MAG TPA: NmrA family NAD(P)-binding protein [Candidatus Acidoferrales bacterium]|jgi:nucleoside-diphosphate-sugar epimerase|nr:NmrA family NAD(P)-binding protein [Candidatus Acidoferrales bacterium]